MQFKIYFPVKKWDLGCEHSFIQASKVDVRFRVGNMSLLGGFEQSLADFGDVSSGDIAKSEIRCPEYFNIYNYCGFVGLSHISIPVSKKNTWQWWKMWPFHGNSVIPSFLKTLSPIIMEVENYPKWKETNIRGTNFPLPWLWEEGYSRMVVLPPLIWRICSSKWKGFPKIFRSEHKT